MSEANTPSRRRLLVIDDNESIHADYRKILELPDRPSSLNAAKAALFGSAPTPATPAGRMSFVVDTATQGQEGLRKVEEALQAGDSYAVAFVDMRMPPGWDGVQTIRHIWQVDEDIQVVICTAFSDYSLEDITRELGRHDRLLLLKKPFDNVEILQLANALSEKWVLKRQAALKMEALERMVQERTAQIEHALLHDKLTDLPNRALLTERLNAAIERHRRHPDYKFAILFLDFDRFKLINDSLGHEVGDLLLVEVAERLRESLRATDLISHASTAARLGGDEFLVLLEDLREEQDAARVAERLLKVLSEPYSLNQQMIHVTISTGIATSDRGYGRAGDMIRDADTAMYRAKAAGRARYVMFDQRMHEEVTDRIEMENGLRQAVQEMDFSLHYQPIIDLRKGRLAAFEALVRWQHPRRGLVTASELIPIAEDTGLVLPLSLWVLEEACRQLKTWRDRYPEMQHLLMSVNLSRKQLIDSELVEHISGIIAGAGLQPRDVVLEITESAVLDDPATAVQIFKRLQEMGVWLHLDDFGTGYSSLSCLYQFPLSGLKIDRSFIANLTSRPEHTTMLEAIVKMARAFNLQVVGEGVETAEQAELITQLRVDHAQGFYYDHPRDPRGAETFIRKQLAACAVS